MSKWLKRGKQGSSSNLQQNSVENGPEASVRTNMAPGAAYATAPQPPPPQSNMAHAGYASATGQHHGHAGMDVIDGGNYHHGDSRSKYQSSSSQNYHHGGSGGGGSGSTSHGGQRRSSSRTRHPSPSSRGSGGTDDNGDGGGGGGRTSRQRSRSNRSSSGRSSSSRNRDRSSSSASQQQHAAAHAQQQQPSNGSYHHYAPDPGQAQAGGATHAPHGGPPGSAQHPPQHHQSSYGGGGPPPPQTQTAGPPPQYGKPSATVTPPQDPTSAPGGTNVPSYPPAVSTSGSQQSSHRRPAYLLHRDLVIGKGSYGQVCIASRGEAEGHTTSSGSGKRKKFACKCVVLRNDPKYIAKLQEEVNVLRELRGHENVIRLYDVFCVDNELFIITELGRGGDLFHLLTTHPKHGVTEAYAAKTVAQMLSAVAFLHSRNICHRDLKLENWVLESGKDVWSPLKLIDFGLSTHFTLGHRLSRVVGSSYYVAPEVLKKSYTEACDLWSLGVIVYMLLSGAPPFYGKNDEAIKASIVQGEYTFPHELFRDVSDEAMAFVSCLLSYNTEYRYTAEQALTHGWLASNCDPDQLQRAKDGARGVGPACASMSELGIPEPMQL